MEKEGEQNYTSPCKGTQTGAPRSADHPHTQAASRADRSCQRKQNSNAVGKAVAQARRGTIQRAGLGHTGQRQDKEKVLRRSTTCKLE